VRTCGAAPGLQSNGGLAAFALAELAELGVERLFELPSAAVDGGDAQVHRASLSFALTW
jgi:hypothetical protein